MLDKVAHPTLLSDVTHVTHANLNFSRNPHMFLLADKQASEVMPLTLGVKDADHLLAEAALRLGGGAFHVEHYGVALHLNKLSDIHSAAIHIRGGDRQPAEAASSQRL